MNKTVADMTIPELIAKRDEFANYYAIATAMNSADSDSIKEWFDFLGKELAKRVGAKY